MVKSPIRSSSFEGAENAGLHRGEENSFCYGPSPEDAGCSRGWMLCFEVCASMNVFHIARARVCVCVICVQISILGSSCLLCRSYLILLMIKHN